MPVATVNGIGLYFEEYGEGPAILGVHGTPSSVVLWVEAARELAGVGRCIVYDRRGFGRSRPAEPFDSLHLDEHVEDAHALLGALDARPAVIIGRSTGGLIALALAHRHPDSVRGLVLLEPAVFTADPDAATWAGSLRRAVQKASTDPSQASRAVFDSALGPRAWEELPAELRELFADAGPAVLAEIRGRGLDLSEEPLRLRDEEMAGIARPTLLVSSEGSPEVFRLVNDRLAAALPLAERVTVPGGHLISPSHPLVVDWVRRLLRAPR